MPLNAEMILAKTMAEEALAGALREKFPGKSALSDAQLVAEFVKPEMVNALIEYFVSIEESRDHLDRKLVNVG